MTKDNADATGGHTAGLLAALNSAIEDIEGLAFNIRNPRSRQIISQRVREYREVAAKATGAKS